jgi:asparagine synthase (glutamine-hydrolysing)
VSDAELILRAFTRWGADGFARLEGEFACVVYNHESGETHAARDFAGMRPLYYAEHGGTFSLASRAEGLLADRTLPRTLDLTALTSVAAGLWGHSPQTAIRAILELPAGHHLVRAARGTTRVRAFWSPPERLLTRRQPIQPAAEELRALLTDAVRERLAPEGPTAVSLSGGWDSSAVGGAAVAALGSASRERLRPVSISYPVGDPGREDEIIAETLSAWRLPPDWIDVDSIALLPGTTADVLHGASVRALPFAHVYEQWNRALSRRARASGARVILDGVGGDQLFQVSDIFLADLFARGQWIELARQWRTREMRGLGAFWEWALLPAFPDAVARGLARVQRLPITPHYLLRLPPPWFRARFFAEHGVMANEAAHHPRLPQHDRVLAETHAFLRFPFFTRVVALLRGYAAEEGVTLHSPLLDDRVVRFAASRPWSERADGRETKILLRRSMQGLVPESVLAPRPFRTGITTGYFLRQLRGPARPVLESLLSDPLLGSIGMIDPVRLRRAWDHLMQHEDGETAARVYFTLQTELWLRARSDQLPRADAQRRPTA